MHIDALDAAAALAGIVGRAVHQRIDGRIEIGVFHDIARILAAEFEAEAGEGAGRCALDRPAAFDRAGEIDEVEAAGRNQRRGRLMVEEDVLEDILRNAGLDEGLHQRSPTRIVWLACLRMTVLPAISAGAIVLIAVM